MTNTWVETAPSNTFLGQFYVFFSSSPFSHRISKAPAAWTPQGTKLCSSGSASGLYKSHTASASCRGALNPQAVQLVCARVFACLPAYIHLCLCFVRNLMHQHRLANRIYLQGAAVRSYQSPPSLVCLQQWWRRGVRKMCIFFGLCRHY